MIHGSDADSVARLFGADGHRKYVCSTEWRRFLSAAETFDPASRAFAQLLALTGCRISEALSLTPSQLDSETNRVILRSLKRRKRVFRAVPIPADLMARLGQLACGKEPDARLWTWCRQTGWRHCKRIMQSAGIFGTQASPKGLRHGFGIANAEHNVPPALTQRWMGHARLETTSIYQHAVGSEERAFAERLWKRP
jgi:integrase/recombinase XerD